MKFIKNYNPGFFLQPVKADFFADASRAFNDQCPMVLIIPAKIVVIIGDGCAQRCLSNLSWAHNEYHLPIVLQMFGKD